MQQNFTRRELLRLGAATVVAELASLGLDGCGGGSNTSPSPSPACSTLADIEHVVILIQENRSFDHYFGSYRGVRGFSDQSMAFQQPDPANTSGSPVGVLLPFHLDTSKTNAACTHDITHDWVPQHQSWNNGAMDGFVSSRLPIDSNDAVIKYGLLQSRRPSLLLRSSRCLHDLRQLLLLGDGPDRPESPLHDGGLHRPRWKKRRTDFADHRHKPHSCFTVV